tara:strand:+ start:2176 stop:2826 length:651 start_codon:yes stop_codon:yes gene_type:complete
MHKIHITLEGNLGVGKSTILSNVYEYFGIDSGIAYAWEPVHDWDTNGFLEGMYTGKISHPEFQHAVLSSMFHTTYKQLANTDVLLQERSMDTTFQVFSKCNVTDNNSLNILQYSYNNLNNVLRTKYSIETHRIYLRVPPHISFSRTTRRSRTSETSVSQEYINNINNAYEQWLGFTENEHTTIIDASQNISDVTNDVITAINTIINKKKNPKKLFA